LVRRRKDSNHGHAGLSQTKYARIALVTPKQTHLDLDWAEDKYQVAIATGQSTKIDYLKLQPPGTRDHGSYGVAAGLQNNFYGLGVNADTIIK
jgi:hypothetical protein